MGPDNRDRVHVLRAHVRQFQTGSDSTAGKGFVAAPMQAAAHQFGLFHGSEQRAVLQDGAGGIAQDAADSENDHYLPFSRFSILAQASFSPTVRLNTNLPAAESGSTQK